MEGMEWIGLLLDEPIKGTLILALLGMLDSLPGRGVEDEKLTSLVNEEMGRFHGTSGYAMTRILLNASHGTTCRIHFGKWMGQHWRDHDLLSKCPSFMAMAYHGVPQLPPHLCFPHHSLNTFSFWDHSRFFEIQADLSSKGVPNDGLFLFYKIFFPEDTAGKKGQIYIRIL